ncbi:MAG: hypothetical protein EHM48_00270 [Planctomycetaceae bacterium]|nr:MAG: hypothetical protein EHM48_00270 [Planctomycetaceae bacterium]
MEQAERSLVEFVGKEKLLSEVTPADADGYVIFLRARLSEATVRRQCGRVKQFFNAARKAKLLIENPFAGVRSTDFVNRDREHVVTPQEVSAILEACPSVEWRLIVAIPYYAGLRTPSETLALRWADVNWDKKTLRVHACKTEHESGGGVRDVPVCVELMALLLQAFEQAEPGSEYVISDHHGMGKNLRTHLMRIMDKAGVDRFQKPFQNMRASCKTNWLVLGIPESQVSDWIGHAVKVGRKHYHQAREAWAKLVTEGDGKAQQKAQHSLAKAPQKAQQHEAALNCTNSQNDQNKADLQGNCEIMRNDAELCGSGAMQLTPRLGLEPRT